MSSINNPELFKKVLASEKKLEEWIEEQQYVGWDPYDGLYSEFLDKHVHNIYLQILLVQLSRISPINFRPLLKIKKDVDLKGISLILLAYANMYKATGKTVYLERCAKLKDMIIERSLINICGYHCWSSHYYVYVGADKSKMLPDVPDVIGTINCMKGLAAYYQIQPDNDVKDVIQSTYQFFKDTIRTTESGITYVLYNPVTLHKIVPNATMEMLDALSCCFPIVHDEEMRILAQKCLVSMFPLQKEDGTWEYAYYHDGHEYHQLDFHQGYMIDGLLGFKKYVDNDEIKERLEVSLKKAADAYMQQFPDMKRSYYRKPKFWPIETHNQSQGIITFAALFQEYREERYLEYLENIMEWTIDNLQLKSGTYVYQKGKIITNKIAYMRWTQGWMLVALSQALLLNQQM